MHVDLDQSGTDDSRKIHAAGCPPIITVTLFASRLAPENTCPAGTAGFAGPNPVPHRMITSPGLAGAAWSHSCCRRAAHDVGCGCRKQARRECRVVDHECVGGAGRRVDNDLYRSEGSIVGRWIFTCEG